MPSPLQCFKKVKMPDFEWKVKFDRLYAESHHQIFAVRFIFLLGYKVIAFSGQTALQTPHP